MIVELADAHPAAQPYTMPGSTAPVSMARLALDPDTGASLSLVRFPKGWRRPERGHYGVGEEFLVVEGELHVSGTRHVAGDLAWIPAGALRHGSGTDGGALAVAWFSGPVRWTASDDDVPTGPSTRTNVRTVAVPPRDGLVLRGGRPGEAHGTTALFACPDDVPAALLCPGTTVTDVSRWRWRPAEASRARPAWHGRLLVRTG
ncbi:cupin domain-containing protein [Yinghuangia soli]|uniref:ChrR-like cupin domain-containing protein n=1 Tax=Yinghuangia soli TaxID=2908204 RepID=A0AA41Q5T1_9ACTN|nr:hypothetical protein [Yinghuangia soli]MCF2531515.1 hypothetical protein [Yinghuangia soli]